MLLVSMHLCSEIGVGYGMEIDLYKFQFLDGCPDGIWYKNETLQTRVLNRMRMCLFLGYWTYTFPCLAGNDNIFDVFKS